MHCLDPHRGRSTRRAGFTIIELLAATAVLTVLILIVSQMVSSTSRTVGHDERRLESDANARMVFDRMQMDLDAMPKRGDLDVSFSIKAGDDSFFFYSQAPGLYAADIAQKNSLSLVGYAVDSKFHLDRYGKGMKWDGGAGTSVNFLTFTTGNYTPEPDSTITGSLSKSGDSYTPSLDANGIPNGSWQILSDNVFRMEICFLLKDGNYSSLPGINATLGTPVGSQTQAGTRVVTTDSKGGYNTYLCVRGASGGANAVWQPIGLGDVQAVIVTIALLDQKSRIISDLTAAAANLPDAPTGVFTADKLPAKTWQQAVNDGNLGLPKAVQGNVRIYQRAIYLNP
jgi:prepilin-type N-terminal cleavage/methylation domain-containing protein